MTTETSTEITAPILPESVADAVVLDWKKQVGDTCRRDEIIVEVETDKIVLEVAVPADGILTEILQPTGSTVTAGQPLANFTADIKSDDDKSPADNGPAENLPNENANDIKNATAEDAQTEETEEILSPAVRRLVAEYGINLADIKGSGPDERITKQDVLAYIDNQVSPDNTDNSAAQPNIAKSGITNPDIELPQKISTQKESLPTESTTDRTESRTPMSRLRQTVATRLLAAQHNAALLTTFNEVNMQSVLDLRTTYRAKFEKKHGVRLGLMSFFVTACVAALQKFPLINSRIDGSDIIQPNYHDIGIAVASARGLVVPILRDCATLSFADIEKQIRDFGKRAAAGKLDISELNGGTFTITNGGVFGSLLSTPILNPPQSAILGMHKIQSRPVAENGQVVIRPMMYLALTYDHRLIDGKQAVEFLVAVKESLEYPGLSWLEI